MDQDIDKGVGATESARGPDENRLAPSTQLDPLSQTTKEVDMQDLSVLSERLGRMEKVLKDLERGRLDRIEKVLKDLKRGQEELLKGQQSIRSDPQRDHQRFEQKLDTLLARVRDPRKGQAASPSGPTTLSVAERESDELDRAYNSARDRYLVAIDRRSRCVFTGLVPPHIDQRKEFDEARANWIEVAKKCVPGERR